MTAKTGNGKAPKKNIAYFSMWSWASLKSTQIHKYKTFFIVFPYGYIPNQYPYYLSSALYSLILPLAAWDFKDYLCTILLPGLAWRLFFSFAFHPILGFSSRPRSLHTHYKTLSETSDLTLNLLSKHYSKACKWRGMKQCSLCTHDVASTVLKIYHKVSHLSMYSHIR